MSSWRSKITNHLLDLWLQHSLHRRSSIHSLDCPAYISEFGFSTGIFLQLKAIVVHNWPGNVTSPWRLGFHSLIIWTLPGIWRLLKTDHRTKPRLTPPPDADISCRQLCMFNVENVSSNTSFFPAWPAITSVQHDSNAILRKGGVKLITKSLHNHSMVPEELSV